MKMLLKVVLTLSIVHLLGYSFPVFEKIKMGNHSDTASADSGSRDL